MIAPFLIILRVANRNALTSEAIASGGNIGSIRFKSRRELTSGNGTLPDTNPVSSVETVGEAPCEFGTATDDMIEEVPL